MTPENNTWNLLYLHQNTRLVNHFDGSTLTIIFQFPIEKLMMSIKCKMYFIKMFMLKNTILKNYRNFEY